MVVLTMLLSVSSAGLLADHPPAGVFLVEGGALAQASSAPDERSVEQLHADLDTLERSKPSVVPGILLLVLGGVGEVAGVGLGVLSLFGLWGTGLLVALVTVLIATGVVAVGVVLVVRAIVTRRRVDRDLSVIRQRLEALESAPTPSPGMPPQVRGPEASVLVAKF